mgnify:CR=1 FL=1
MTAYLASRAHKGTLLVAASGNASGVREIELDLFTNEQQLRVKVIFGGCFFPPIFLTN